MRGFFGCLAVCVCAAVAAILTVSGSGAAAQHVSPEPTEYRLYVANESSDIVSMVATRVTPAEHAAWQDKAASAGVSPSALLRQAMARTRTWTAPALAIERERTRQLARIGNNLNQLARWANTHTSAVEAVAVIANLVSFERSLLAVARMGGDGGNAH